jgi:hypothetical protein
MHTHGHNVSGTAQVLAGRCWVGQYRDGPGSVSCRDAGRDTVSRVDADTESRRGTHGFTTAHRRQHKAIAAQSGHGDTPESGSVPDHERDLPGRHIVGGQHQLGSPAVDQHDGLSGGESPERSCHDVARPDHTSGWSLIAVGAVPGLRRFRPCRAHDGVPVGRLFGAQAHRLPVIPHRCPPGARCVRVRRCRAAASTCPRSFDRAGSGHSRTRRS